MVFGRYRGGKGVWGGRERGEGRKVGRGREGGGCENLERVGRKRCERTR